MYMNVYRAAYMYIRSGGYGDSKVAGGVRIPPHVPFKMAQRVPPHEPFNLAQRFTYPPVGLLTHP